MATNDNFKSLYKRPLFEKYVLWKSLPFELLALPIEQAERHVADERIQELVGITTQKQFAEHFGIGNPGTLSRWNKVIRKNDLDQRPFEWARGLTRHIIFALYKKALKTGDPKSVELWMKLNAGWHPDENKPTPEENQDRKVLYKMQQEIAAIANR